MSNHRVPGSLPDQPRWSSSSPTSTRLDDTLNPRQAALLAAEQRLKSVPQTSTPQDAHRRESNTPFNPSRSDILKFSRIMDSNILPNCSKTQAVETLTTIETLLTNILSPPNPASSSKYRQIRLSNPLIQRTIVSVSNSSPKDYLVACSFRTQTIEFTPYLVFPPSPTPQQLHQLKTGLHVLRNTLKRAQEAKEREVRAREGEKEVEERRKQNALLGFEEDRRLRAEKDERERYARESKTTLSPPLPSSSTSTHAPRFPTSYPTSRRRSGGQTLSGVTAHSHSAEDDHDEAYLTGEGEDEDDRDLPPSYGELHGRVLGTGLPERSRNDIGVSRQDLEDS